jgi:hypothetical protein
MAIRVGKIPPALKHAGFSAASILPGECTAEFEKLHQELVAELTPNGGLENEIVATLARLFWRRRNLATFRVAKLAQQRMTQIRGTIAPTIEAPKSDQSIEFERIFGEKWRAAEDQGRKELGELYALVEMGEEATVDCLIKDLDVQERLDAMIDRCLKRLLMVRGLKSMLIGSTSASPKSLPGPDGVA